MLLHSTSHASLQHACHTASAFHEAQLTSAATVFNCHLWKIPVLFLITCCLDAAPPISPRPEITR
jgi:hypothetical protein